MKQTKAPATTPSPTREISQPAAAEGNAAHSQVFMGLVFDMSWRLAVVVLVPVVGGFKLDDTLHTTPALTIFGFLVALGGTGLVMRRMLQVANRLPVPKREEPR